MSLIFDRTGEWFVLGMSQGLGVTLCGKHLSHDILV